MTISKLRKAPGLSAPTETTGEKRGASSPVDLTRTWWGAEISSDADALHWLEQAPFGDQFEPAALWSDATPTDLASWVGYPATPTVQAPEEVTS
jgi:hypothetical protein